MNRIISSIAAVLVAGTASAQSANVQIQASATTIEPGEIVTIDVVCDYDLAGAGGGVFGQAGFYGFGGNIVAGVAGELTTDFIVINTDLSSGVAAGSSVDTGINKVGAGRGVLTPLTADPITLVSFTVMVDADASGGDVTLDFEGAVVLVAGDALVSVASDPGVNQTQLTTTPVTITVAGICPADITGDGILNNGDINAFVTAFLSELPAADQNNDGFWNSTDINLFVNNFLAGCN